MFWKKKADTGSEAETPQEDTADRTVGREADGPESSDPEMPDQETPEKSGLVARIKSQLARTKSRLAALIRRFKKPPVFQAEADQAQDDSGHSESPSDDTSSPKPVNLKKRLILGGAIGLAILLLMGAGFAVWKIFLSAPDEDADTPVPVEAPRSARPAIPRAEIEALKKKNEELQAQVETLKKEPAPQQPAEPTAQQAGDSIPSQSDSGEITIGNKDAKATAKALKEAIETMNEGAD